MPFHRYLDQLREVLGRRGRNVLVERAAILLVVLAIVVGLLIIANQHDVNVYNNIIGGNSE